MVIHFWDSGSKSIAQFIQHTADLVTYSPCESLEDVIEALSQLGDGIFLFDLDLDKKNIEKAVKKIKKINSNSKIIYICNSLTGQELVRHQKSKEGADAYFKIPLSVELFKIIIEDISGEVLESNPKVSLTSNEILQVKKVVNSHQTGESENSAELEEVSKKIQDSFDIVFTDEDEATGKLKTLDELDSSQKIDTQMYEFEVSLDHSMENDLSNKFGFSDISLDDSDAIDIEDDEYEDEDEMIEESNQYGEIGLSIDEIEVIEEIEEKNENVLDLTSNDINLSEISITDQNNNELMSSEKVSTMDKELDLDGVQELELGESSIEENSLAIDLEDAKLQENDISLSIDATNMDSLTLSESQNESIGFSDDQLMDELDLNFIDEGSSDSFDNKLEQISDHNDPLSDLENNFGADEFSFNAQDSNVSDELQGIEQSESIMAKIAEIEAMSQKDDLVSLNTQQESLINTSQSQTLRDYKDVSLMHSLELEKLGETIKTLREDRQILLQKVEEFENAKAIEKHEILSLRSELDEKKIELAVIRRRFESQIEDLKVELNLSLDKKQLVELKNRELENELDGLNQKVKIDVNKVKSREKELESKLELLKSDAQIQIKNRDAIILDLKRKIDTLEFDLETIKNREKKGLTNKYQLEDKMEKVIKTLKNAIGELEDNQENSSSIQDLKKNLDV